MYTPRVSVLSIRGPAKCLQAVSPPNQYPTSERPPRSPWVHMPENYSHIVTPGSALGPALSIHDTSNGSWVYNQTIPGSLRFESEDFGVGARKASRHRGTC